MAQDDQEKMGSILHQDEFYLPLQFSSPCALLFSTMKEVYYILGSGDFHTKKVTITNGHRTIP